MLIGLASAERMAMTSSLYPGRSAFMLAVSRGDQAADLPRSHLQIVIEAALAASKITVTDEAELNRLCEASARVVCDHLGISPNNGENASVRHGGA